MIKILSLLLLSLTFIGSANANSIKGAFGYKLGGVFNSSAIGTFTHNFKPKEPLPGLDRYSISRTVSDKKIYGIYALTRDDNYVNALNPGFNDYCTSMISSPHHKVLSLLKVKYGKFNKVIDEYEKYTYAGETERWQLGYEFMDGDRYINLYCSARTTDGVGVYILSLSYVDSKLRNRANQEYRELMNDELEDEASDYDI